MTEFETRVRARLTTGYGIDMEIKLITHKGGKPNKKELATFIMDDIYNDAELYESRKCLHYMRAQDKIRRTLKNIVFEYCGLNKPYKEDE